MYAETPQMDTFTNSEDPEEMPHIMWHFIRVYTVCKGKKDLQTKTQYFFKLQPDTPKFMYSGLSQVYCIKPE